MTFDHQIDFDPATRGSAVTALKAERQVIVRKLLVAQAFAEVPDQQQRCVYPAAAQLSVPYGQHHGPIPTVCSARAQLQTTT